MSNRPNISIILCSRNRAQRLPACFDAIHRLTYPRDRWELVFVDNGSEDDTKAVVNRAFAEAGYSAHYLYEPRPGQAAARNTGLAAANGEILVFTDDDCLVDPGWLDAYAALFSDRAIGFAGGRVLPHRETTARLSIQTSRQAIDFRPGALFPVGAIHGANMACRCEALAKVGGFDLNFGAGGALRSAEDADLIGRMLKAGWPGRYSPEPVVRHDHGRQTAAAVARTRRAYDVGRGGFFVKMILLRGTEDDRRAYARKWYWRLRGYVRRGQWGPLAREITGGLRSLVLFVRGRALGLVAAARR